MSAAVPSGTASMALPDGITLRPATDADLPVLEAIYGSTRVEELAPTGWDAAQKAAFIAFQFQAQHQHYRTHYADAEFLVIERRGTVIGRLYLHWRRSELRIVDIALLPEARGEGIGGALLEQLIAAAARDGRGVSIHVEQANPAMALYRRLGFGKVGEHGVYHLMERRADEP